LLGIGLPGGIVPPGDHGRNGRSCWFGGDPGNPAAASRRRKRGARP
jgi:hypothetical protein